MKKLMIAAAAAAMIVSAEAVADRSAEYQFVANLQTTGYHVGQEVYTAGCVQMGMNAQRKFWYDDDSLKNVWSAGSYLAFEYKGAKYTSKTIKCTTKISAGNKVVPYLEIVSTTINGQALPIITETEAAYLNSLKEKYPLPSYNVWCLELSWYTYDAGQCFRVNGSEAIVETLYLAKDCCNENTQAFKGSNGAFVQWGPGKEVNRGLLNWYGAQDEANAMNLEFYGKFQGWTYSKDDSRRVVGWLAGQGYRSAEINGFPALISGTIVGTMPAPYCPDCCTEVLDAAIAWDICGNGIPNDIEGRNQPYTAAFGTFYVKFVKFNSVQ